jgi:type IV pilus assembly protein PilP
MGTLGGCSSNDGFADLDRFFKEVDARPRGKIESLPEVQVYRSFTYSAANLRSPFVPPEDVVVKEIQLAREQSNVKPDLDRPREVLESFSLGELKMVGTLRRDQTPVLWALIADNEGGIHMAKQGQYMGKNHGRIVEVAEGRMSLIEIVPNGYGGWLERPRTISLDDQ